MATEFKDLSPDQQQVVQTWGQGLAVTAGAGSGKTTTLVIKCEELMKRNPQAHFAAVSFTERSASDLRAKLSARLNLQGAGGALSGHWVMTIHGLCGAIIREFPREAGLDGEEVILSEAEARLLWERALETLWFGELPVGLEQAINRLLQRESRDSVIQLLTRTRDLHSFGVESELLKSKCEISQALGLVGQFVLDRYARLKKRRGAIDFSDLELGADRALDSQRVREHFHRRFELVMVDEFQDTNPVQARIILKFVRPDLSNVCVVGDPKQSIYRFRDADVSVFDEFCAKLPQKRSLSWNFRSRPQIIDYTNHICQKAFEASEMLYEPLEAKREPQESLDAVVRLDIADPDELGEWIRGEVARGVSLDEMAVLVRRIRGNEKWFKALSSQGIPLAMGSGGLFWEDSRVRELVALLKWWDHPANSLSGAVFLRAPWIGISDLELDRWVKEDPTWSGPFFTSGHLVAESLSQLRGKVIRPGELLMALLVSTELEDEIGSAVLGLWHRVEEFSSSGLDFHSVVLEISRALEEKRRERDIPPPKNQGQLPVLTFHAAKGLEFNHVILVDLGKKPRTASAPLLFWDRKQGVFLAPRTQEGDRDDDHLGFAEWKLLERARNLAESKRIFYVALTRAKERLILVCLGLPLKQIEKGFDAEEAYLEDDWRAWVECAGKSLPSARIQEGGVSPTNLVLSVSDPSSQICPSLNKEHRAVQWVRPRHSVTEWNLLSHCPRAYEWKFIRPRWVTQVAESGSGGNSFSVDLRTLGTEVHAALEVNDFEALGEIEKKFGEKIFRAAPLIDWMQAQPQVDASDLLGVWSELAFEVPIGGEVLVGSIDRLVLTASSGYHLIDYKVSTMKKSESELLASYQTQMELYVAAVKAMLGETSSVAISASLIQISPEGVVEVPVPIELQKIQLQIEKLAQLAAAITSKESGIPNPGAHCHFCEFRSMCSSVLVR